MCVSRVIASIKNCSSDDADGTTLKISFVIHTWWGVAHAAAYDCLAALTRFPIEDLVTMVWLAPSRRTVEIQNSREPVTYLEGAGELVPSPDMLADDP